MKHTLGLTSLALATLMAIAVLAAAGTGYAQPSPEYDTDDLVARGLFENGRAAFDEGRYSEALNYFQQAYDHSHRPRLLYNIAQSADRMRMDRTALNAFRKYLELVPDAENRREVENRIRALEMFVVDSEAQPATPTRTAPQAAPVAPSTQPQVGPAPVADASASATTAPNLAPWLVAGAGGVVTVVGVVLFATGESRISNVEDAPQRSSWASVRDDADSGPAYRDAGIATFTLGVIGVAVGVTWALSTGGDDEGRSVTAFVGPAGIALRGSL